MAREIRRSSLGHGKLVARNITILFSEMFQHLDFINQHKTEQRYRIHKNNCQLPLVFSTPGNSTVVAFFPSSGILSSTDEYLYSHHAN